MSAWRAVAAVVLLAPSIAHAGDSASKPKESAPREHRLKWRPEWPRFRIIEYGVVALAYEEYAFIEYRIQQPTVPRWQGPILFDQAFRDVFRLHDKSARLTAAQISDGLTLFDQVEPAVMSALVPLVFDRGNFDIAWQLTMMNAEAGAFEGVLVRSSNHIAARARPFADVCKVDKNYGDCGGITNSFPSGHAMAAFTGAGLTCAHHLHLPLYGGGWPDIAACALDLTVATSTSVMRLISDNHWASDIFLGGMLGFSLGFGLPHLLHYYRAGAPVVSAGSLAFAVLPRVTEGEVGVRALGVF